MNEETRIMIELTAEEMRTVVGGVGSQIDPNGGTNNSEPGDNGCGIDPNG